MDFTARCGKPFKSTSTVITTPPSGESSNTPVANDHISHASDHNRGPHHLRETDRLSPVPAHCSPPRLRVEWWASHHETLFRRPSEFCHASTRTPRLLAA